MIKIFYRFKTLIEDQIKSGILIFKRDNKSKFSSIYKLNYWKSKNGSKSGFGSNLNSTINLRKDLKNFITKKKIKTFLDIPCGDFFWMKKINLKGIKYTGADIVEDIISYNNFHYSQKNIKFILKDLIKDNIEKYDVVFVRDCFVHLSDKEIASSLKNICSSGSKYFISTYFNKHWSNIKSKKIDNWRPLNIMQKPFNLPSPDYILKDHSSNNKFDKNKFMGVWQIKKIKNKMIK